MDPATSHWGSMYDGDFYYYTSIENKALLGFVSQKGYRLLPKLMLSGGGTFSPRRCLCRRSSWFMAR
jgi:hypothetical protein